MVSFNSDETKRHVPSVGGYSEVLRHRVTKDCIVVNGNVEVAVFGLFYLIRQDS